MSRPTKPTYEYIRNAYGIDYQIGERVRLEDSDREGVVMRPKASHGHYVQVRFDGYGPGLCHPRSLIKLDTSPADPV